MDHLLVRQKENKTFCYNIPFYCGQKQFSTKTKVESQHLQKQGAFKQQRYLNIHQQQSG